MKTAATLFGEKGYDAASLKEISKRADVTPAMISYYFDDKHGLLKAVMELATSMMFRLFEQIVEKAGEDNFVPTFTELYLGFITKHSWIVPLFTREVLANNAAARQMFLQDFAPQARSMISTLLRKEIDNGVLRADLDPDFAELSLVGMSIFPVLAAPVLSSVIGYVADEEFAKNYAEHAQTLFLKGAGTGN